jgi:hypothetical protein
MHLKTVSAATHALSRAVGPPLEFRYLRGLTPQSHPTTVFVNLMPGLLPIDTRGLLSLGIHDATLDEIEQVFGRFQTTSRRCELMAKLRAYVTEVRRSIVGAHVIVDGSFIMATVDAPNDIDAILVLPANWNISAPLRPFEYNLIATKRVRAQFKFDVYAVLQASAEYDYWVDFFGQVNQKWLAQIGLPLGACKGLVRVI